MPYTAFMFSASAPWNVLRPYAEKIQRGRAWDTFNLISIVVVNALLLPKQNMEQLSWFTSIADYLPMSASETMPADISHLSEMQVIRNVGFLKSRKSTEPDGLCSSVFKDVGQVLASELAKLLGPIWLVEKIPKDWHESLIVSIYEKGDTSSCKSHRRVTSVSIASKLLAWIILHRLPSSGGRWRR